MLTTTLDGLWVLQVLTGIEVLAPELGLRPHLPSVESRQTALEHPVAEELRDAGVIGADGIVDDTVRDWLTVLSRRDVALLLLIRTPEQTEAQRVLIARFAQWWVSLERNGIAIRIAGAGTATSELSAGALISAQIDRLCGSMPPAGFRPATIDVAGLRSAVYDAGSLRAFLNTRSLDADQVSLLAQAADTERSAQASVVAIQSGIAGPARSHIESGVVTIIDTPQGRLVTEHVDRGDKVWMIASPGGAANVSRAVLTMLRRLPAHDDWFAYRKVV